MKQLPKKNNYLRNKKNALCGTKLCLETSLKTDTHAKSHFLQIYIINLFVKCMSVNIINHL